VLPATLFIRPDGDVTVVASALRREFADAGVEFNLSALRGLDHWATLKDPKGGHRKAIPAIPPDLLREVGTAVATRRPGVLHLALQCAGTILKRLKHSTDRQFRDSLVIGLDYLLTEAAYSELSRERSGSIPYEEVPGIRCEAAELARCLSLLGHDTSPTVRQWLETAATDPLPEVRQAIEIAIDFVN
jgi:hypothetical protein